METNNQPNLSNVSENFSIKSKNLVDVTKDKMLLEIIIDLLAYLLMVCSEIIIVHWICNVFFGKTFLEMPMLVSSSFIIFANFILYKIDSDYRS